ncbi:cold shock domain-containing protein [Epilithonimonas sp.]|uniref:cold-shock protein n=1 Tax=Epilithonimonas sp. TaxID=2894511 RepID=UPI0028A21BBB|nr:cold shock domain-containing protein [Epilithonimonas sp.]
MADSFSKKENFKKKQQKQKEKALRREERKTNNDKGKEVEYMYVDAYGRLTSTPPEEKLEVDLDNIQLGAAPVEAEETVKTGIVTFLSEKGYGFITENKTNENIFFHSNNCAMPVKKGNKVAFEKERSPKGFSAVNIELVK